VYGFISVDESICCALGPQIGNANVIFAIQRGEVLCRKRRCPIQLPLPPDLHLLPPQVRNAIIIQVENHNKCCLRVVELFTVTHRRLVYMHWSISIYRSVSRTSRSIGNTYTVPIDNLHAILTLLTAQQLIPDLLFTFCKALPSHAPVCLLHVITFIIARAAWLSF
jgi:hypothetical protein